MLITEDAAYCGRGIMMTTKKQRERNASVQLSFHFICYSSLENEDAHIQDESLSSVKLFWKCHSRHRHTVCFDGDFKLYPIDNNTY